jgi:hypothetical protein
MGADFILTGSINHYTVEAGTSRLSITFLLSAFVEHPLGFNKRDHDLSDCVEMAKIGNLTKFNGKIL